MHRGMGEISGVSSQLSVHGSWTNWRKADYCRGDRQVARNLAKGNLPVDLTVAPTLRRQNRGN